MLLFLGGAEEDEEMVFNSVVLSLMFVFNKVFGSFRNCVFPQLKLGIQWRRPGTRLILQPRELSIKFHLGETLIIASMCRNVRRISD